MSNKTIGILMPGDMGHGCGKVFIENNFRVITSLNGRSDRTKNLSNNAGIEDVETIENVVNFSDVILSICLLYTSPSPRDVEESRMPSSA